MKKIKTKCLILIPVGPNTNISYLDDTLDSINYYIGNEITDCYIILLDDTRDHSLTTSAYFSKENIKHIKAKDYSAEKNRSKPVNGPLFGKIITAINSVIDSIEFEVFLKMDTDTLITGHHPHLDAIDFFKENKNVGILGSYLRKGDGTCKVNGMRLKGNMLKKEISFPYYIRNFKLKLKLSKIIYNAQKFSNYNLGDTVTGGGYFINYNALQQLNKNKLLNDDLRFSLVGEDSLFSLLVSSIGFELSDPKEDYNFMAINWRGLPFPLEEICAKNKKIIHPVKLERPEDEPNIRAYFKKNRS